LTAELRLVGSESAPTVTTPKRQTAPPAIARGERQKAICRESRNRACSTTGSDRGSRCDHDLTLIVSTYVFLDKDFAVRRFDALTIDAATYLADINDELAKGGASALRIDSMATAKSGVVHISLRSLDDWASRRYGISILGDSEFQQFDSSTDTSQPEPQAPQPASEKPWLIAQPNDPLVMQPWFTPARYFARQLVADDPTLRLKRDQLANKVVQLLTDVGIFKRGGKKPFDPGTVKKAFVNVRF
jgi:hypothetical protein